MRLLGPLLRGLTGLQGVHSPAHLLLFRFPRSSHSSRPQLLSARFILPLPIQFSLSPKFQRPDKLITTANILVYVPFAPPPSSIPRIFQRLRPRRMRSKNTCLYYTEFRAFNAAA